MKLIKPSVKLIDFNSNLEIVDYCARICYRSEKKNPEVLYNSLISSGHISMLRHETHYFSIPFKRVAQDLIFIISNNPYVFYYENEITRRLYISTNGNFIYDNKHFYEITKDFEVSIEQVKNDDNFKPIRRFTFEIVTQISTSRELNRVSPNNISEQSTRYVYDEGTLCVPHWISDKDINEYMFCSNAKFTKSNIYLYACDRAFRYYKVAIKNYNLDKQDARGILPLDTATRCAYTYSVKEWENIIKLRYYGTTGKPHPNAKIIAGMIKEKLNKLGYEI